MRTNRLKIGEFSRLCRVTVRTLRHYEEIDLLVPEIVDRDTGYRYYSVAQLQKMQDILSLKGMGFSLEEIRDLFEDETHVPGIDALEEKIRVCEDELRRLKARKAQLKAMVASQKKLKRMEKITIERLPAITVASHRTVIPSFEDLGRLYQNYIDLFAWMDKEGWEVVGQPRAVYVDGAWNQEDPEKWLTIIQVPAHRA